jgi:hypothetical protein
MSDIFIQFDLFLELVKNATHTHQKAEKGLHSSLNEPMLNLLVLAYIKFLLCGRTFQMVSESRTQ